MSTLELRARITAHLAACRQPLTAGEIARKLGYPSHPGGPFYRLLDEMAGDGLVRADRTDPRRVTWRAA